MKKREYSVEKKNYNIINEKRLWVHKDVKEDIEKESNSLYIFTKATDYINKNIIKIGETGTDHYRSVKARIYEQPNSTDTEPLLVLYVLDCVPYIKKGLIKSAKELEGYIHNFFKPKQHSSGAGTEWFEVNVSDVIKLIRVKLKDDEISLIDFKPHFLQEVVLCQLQDAIENSDDINVNVIAELCARFGKTLTYLELFRRLDNDVMLLPAYVHSVFTSFENNIIGDYKDESIGKFTNFKNFSVIDTRKDDWQEKFDENLGKKKLVVFISVQTLEGKFSKLDIIKNVESERKLIVVDEADYGSHTEKSQAVIDYIK